MYARHPLDPPTHAGALASSGNRQGNQAASLSEVEIAFSSASMEPRSR
jgi:hypothetical protein